MAPRFTLPALLAGVALAGCGGSSSTATVAATPSKYQQGLAFSQCMRTHGVPTFPDPTQGGGLIIRGGPGSGVDPSSPAFKSAQQACRSKLPNGGNPPPLSPARREAMLRFSQCMRAHGVPNFPDPTFQGGGARLELRPSSGIDPNSPAFKQAQTACQKDLPGKVTAP